MNVRTAPLHDGIRIALVCITLLVAALAVGSVVGSMPQPPVGAELIGPPAGAFGLPGVAALGIGALLVVGNLTDGGER